jgi:hypothetical protein
MEVAGPGILVDIELVAVNMAVEPSPAAARAGVWPCSFSCTRSSCFLSALV